MEDLFNESTFYGAGKTEAILALQDRSRNSLDPGAEHASPARRVDPVRLVRLVRLVRYAGRSRARYRPFRPANRSRTCGATSWTRHSATRPSRILTVQTAGPARLGAEQTEWPTTVTTSPRAASDSKTFR